MRITVLFPVDSPVASWNMSRGIVAALKRIGVDALAVPLPTLREASEQLLVETKRSCVPFEEIKKSDGVIVSGPEHIGPWIDACYGKEQWESLGIPRAAWLHESCQREDYTIDFDSIRWEADEWFFPAIQDADLHDQEMFAKGRSHWLPFGVDTEVFKPASSFYPGHPLRDGRFDFDVGFIGLLYPKRLAFLQLLARHDHPRIRIGTVSVSDLHGYDYEASVHRYAANLRSIKVFFNLPSLTRTLVTKVFEVLACGRFLLTPQLPPEFGISKNMALFNSPEHLFYYRSSNLAYVAQLLREWPSDEKAEEREKIAAAGCQEVHAKHSLKIRVSEMLRKMGLLADQAVGVN